jgi:hypothetical protein
MSFCVNNLYALLVLSVSRDSEKNFWLNNQLISHEIKNCLARNQCCGSETEFERIRTGKFWPNPKKSLDSVTVVELKFL